MWLDLCGSGGRKIADETEGMTFSELKKYFGQRSVILLHIPAEVLIQAY
jgi:hypothetical protein